MISYNHEKYIAQAIDSVLMQKTSFDYELVVGDDCSTDNTREIIDSKYERNSGVIKVLSRENNVGMHHNFMRTLAACRGQYVAILEADDYWISPDKLTKQVEFLDSHPECSICFHNAFVVDEDGKVLREAAFSGQERISTIKHLVAHNFMTNCSVMFRRGLFAVVPDKWYRLKNSDWLFHILNAQHGMIGYIDEVLSAYRKHSQGIWTRLSYQEVLQARLLGYLTINSYLNYEYEDIAKPLILNHWDWLENIYAEHGFQILKSQSPPIDIETIFSDWPADLPLPNKWKIQVLARAFERVLFLSYSERDYARTKFCLLKLAKYDISRFKNKGILYIGTWILLGGKFTGLGLRLYRSIKDPLSNIHHINSTDTKRQK